MQLFNVHLRLFGGPSGARHSQSSAGFNVPGPNTRAGMRPDGAARWLFRCTAPTGERQPAAPHHSQGMSDILSRVTRWINPPAQDDTHMRVHIHTTHTDGVTFCSPPFQGLSPLVVAKPQNIPLLLHWHRFDSAAAAMMVRSGITSRLLTTMFNLWLKLHVKVKPIYRLSHMSSCDK